MTCKIRPGDVLEVLRTLPDRSVQCCVTSPPYYGLRDYGVSGQIGLERTPEEYVEKMVAVFREVRRVLRDDGTLWLNLGDTYAGSGGAGGDYSGSGNKAGRQKWRSPFRPTSHVKPKDLIGVPWRVALALQADGCADVQAVRLLERVRDDILDAYQGEIIPDRVLAVLERLAQEHQEAKGASWWLRSDIVWSKTSCMAESVKDRPSRSHEYIFLLSKSKKYFYDIDAARVPHKAVSVARAKRKWVNGRKVTGKIAGSSTNYDIKRSLHPKGRNLRTVWELTPGRFKQAHFATFPRTIPERAIILGTSEGGACAVCGAPFKRQGDTFVPACTCQGAPVVGCVVLDPFNGSGTTGEVALEMGRSYIGIELNDQYTEMTLMRLRSARRKQVGFLPGML